jgi:hypothetical protein
MAEVLITYKAENESLQAVVKETVKGNVAIAESATKAGQVASKAYKDAANSAKAAFGSQEVKKSLDNQVASIDKLAKGSISLKTQLKNLKAEISALDDAGKSGTKQFNQLAISAAKLEDQIGDTQERVKTLASDTFKFDAAIGAVKGLAAGFAVAQGAVGLFAKDNEELQMAIAKTNSAIAILTGLQEIANIVTGQGAAKLGIVTAAQALYTTVVGTSTGALRAFRIAMAATGIGLLVAGVALLVNYFSDLNDEQESASKSLENYQAVAKETDKVLKELNNQITDEKDKLAVLNKDLSKEEALKRKIRRETFEEELKQVQAQFGQSIKLRQERDALAESAKNSAADQIEALPKIEALNKRIAASDQKVADIKNKFNEARATSFKLIDKEAEAELKGADKRAQAAKKAAEDAKNAREKLAQAELDILSRSLDEQSKVLDDSNKEILALEATFREAKFKKGSAEEIEQEKKKQNSIEEIKKQATAKNIELEKQSQEKILAAKLEAAKAGDNATLQVILASLETQQKLELESAETLNKSKLEITTRYGVLIANVNKQIAEANVNTQVNNLKRLEIVEGTSLKRRIELIEIGAEKRKLDAANSIKDDKERASAIKLIDAETQQAKTTETKTETQKQLDLILQYADAVGKTLTSINDLQKQLSENRIAEINLEKETQLNAINESFDTERSKIRQRAALELRANRAIAAEKTKQAKADKALALFNAVIGTAAAVATAKTIPLKILAGFIGAAQVAIILARPIPKFAQGGVVGGQLHSQGGTQIEAEKDEYIVKRSQSVKHRKELDAINTSTQAFRNMINERYVRPAIMNYVLNRKQEQGVTVNASLNSKAMESELRGLRKDIRNSRVRSINSQLDSRYSWQ